VTKTTAARAAGVTFILYIAVGIAQMIIGSRIPNSADVASSLAHTAHFSALVRTNMLLGLVTGFIALVLGIGLYRLTRDEDHDVALLALCCRVGEGLLVVVPVFATTSLLWLANGNAEVEPASVHTLAALLTKLKGWNTTIAATFFSVGSLLFCWLLLRGRTIPLALAYLGIAASVVLVIALPLRMVEVISSSLMNMLWIPMAVFEIPVGVWLLVTSRERLER
jgi:hypothetical protein